jgi:2-polyprenyl-3-methyl-5-hydroxy-6-metoxy-1,4-benzoquinol methylase
MSDSEYIGSELEIFQHAVNWKRYYGGFIKPFLGEEVLEVGAGIGATAEVLISEEQKRWVCLEPDPSLTRQIEDKITAAVLPNSCEARTGDLFSLGPDEKFDSVIYIDVLEHIEDDAAEVNKAAKHLTDRGHLIVLSPAHQFLYSPFDKAIGHFRRYSKEGLSRLAEGLPLELLSIKYLDSVGTAASLANKMLLRSSMPTHGQIGFWDSRLVPVSNFTDKIFGFSIGKSILAVWRRKGEA